MSKDAKERSRAEKLYGDVSSHIMDADTTPVLDRLVESSDEYLDLDRDEASDELKVHMGFLQLDRGEEKDFLNTVVAGLRDTDREGWKSKAMLELNRTYGTQASAKLQEAEEVLDLNPGLKKFLHTHNLGHHPKIIDLLVRKAPGINRRRNKKG
ncbi:MAG: hypothetical protein LC541_04540 [Candidatus Thiodiazotropha sp.]|nr:hypothetical protein [Candidatus Thiodiazotropha sp.]MCM8882585.1 hypothetical protein [Candidatus Thiodiazotropha sp.]MCM8918776.1 hypothetical protein [Candidatus Thiodiazotropha sp.]